MNILVTAGNTTTPIDQVRVITNIFTGRTGAAIAQESQRRGHPTRLLTSHPETSGGVPVETYRSFEDLASLLELRTRERPDAIIHAAAINDYHVAGIYMPDAATRFEPETGHIAGRLVDCAAGKVKSDAPELWLRLTRAPKLIDQIREPWGFAGVLVKFKLEVGVDVAELERIAETSRRHSRADFMVANTLAGAADWALIGPIDGRYDRVSRDRLAERILTIVEAAVRLRT